VHHHGTPPFHVRPSRNLVRISTTRKFVQAYVASGNNGAAAYLKVYPRCKPSSAAASASRLLRHVKVQRRLAELEYRAAKRAEVTRQGLIEEADHILREAIESKQFAAAVAALKEKAILSGLRVERHKRENNTSPVGAARVIYEAGDKPLTEEEWAAKYVTER
jgi:phage terminase small subunit